MYLTLRETTPVLDCMMQLLFIAILSVFLIGCSGDTVEDPYADWSAKDFYEESTLALNSGEFEAAINYLENLEARFPFSPFSRQAQLDIAYAYYKFEEPESAIAAADRFIRINPRDPNVAYAWYLKGRADYTRGQVDSSIATFHAIWRSMTINPCMMRCAVSQR